MNETPHQKFYELLKGYRNAMLITHTGDKLRARPMAIAELQPTCELCFITDVDSAKAHEIQSDTRVLIACQNDSASYLSMSGTARLVQDRQKIAAIWQEPYKVFFPKGKDDPKIALIAFKPEEGEYWDNGGLKKVQYIFEAVKAYVAGEKIHVKEGDQHGHVKL